MLGTLLNTATIIVGGAFGAIVRSGISEKYKKALFDGLGLCCIVLGINAALPNMAKSEFPVLFILSITIGGVIGTKFDLSGRIDRMNAKLNEKQGNENNALNGLVTGILLYTIGTFSIIGPVLSYLSPSHGWAFNEPANTFLYTNATLDLVTSAVLAASYGWIMLLAAPVLFCWQGMFYLIAYMFGSGMPEPMRTELSIVGGVLILSSGLAILGIKDCKTVNLLPSLLIPVIFYIIKGLIM
ncbi:hypothetical protein CIK99_09605 [Prevotella sp. P5-92]|uniref:DUF554 domain-containing protein n=1 Tax=Prevotella sp. P5-92 TaxID=2024222 RepID=UPI000B9613AF|nr:DUF554 domain-containing protein [Prevotella sp. P5-92]OYP56467.1 hypothetical protein CIK99_09605 [Prevotella sp. P5-92]